VHLAGWCTCSGGRVPLFNVLGFLQQSWQRVSINQTISTLVICLHFYLIYLSLNISFLLLLRSFFILLSLWGISNLATTSYYPISQKKELLKHFVGKSLKNIAGPAAVLDLSKLKKNCNQLLEAVDSLKFGWRAHIKTHKVRPIRTTIEV